MCIPTCSGGDAASPPAHRHLEMLWILRWGPISGDDPALLHQPAGGDAAVEKSHPTMAFNDLKTIETKPAL